ncbi:MAG: clostripain-related cysteine peptidase [Anaerolineae bacterium]|jgi:hypothetical protein
MKAEWTVMIYLAGDNDLSAAGDRDLQEMRAVGSTDAVNVVAEFDNAGDRGTCRYHIQPGGADETIVSLGETDSGDPAVLLDFVAWAAKHYPAQRYALILWNHGGGWEPAEMDRIARSVDAQDYTVREVSERSATPLARAFFRTTLETIFSLPTPAERAICSDDGSGHSLDTVELGRVLDQAVGQLGQPLDLLGMDACLMSNLEVAYQARPFAHTMVASEENEPNDGWPYDAILRRLVDHPQMSTPELAAHIVDAYIASYVDRGYTGSVTQSAFDLSRVEALAAPLDDLADALLAHMPDAAQEIWTAQRGSARFWHNTLWDVAHFCEALEGVTADERVEDAAQSVRAALAPGPDRFVIAESHNGTKVELCGGVTVYLLPPLDDLSRYYDELDYAQDHRWLAMLQAYHAA